MKLLQLQLKKVFLRKKLKLLLKNLLKLVLKLRLSNLAFARFAA